MAEWSEYQEKVAKFFRDLGLDAATNVEVRGVRTKHDVDVLVKSKHVGLDIMWLVECKAWNSAVPKEKVLALRTIVDDTGADRGFIMAEKGYQSGALEAARLANVTLTSLADLKETLDYEIGISRLKSLLVRMDSCRDRYWDLDKYDRIEHGLRPDSGASGYSGHMVLRAIDHTLSTALLRGFPVAYDRVTAALSAHGGSVDPVKPDDPGAIKSPNELFDVLHRELTELERRLDAAEAAVNSKS